MSESAEHFFRLGHFVGSETREFRYGNQFEFERTTGVPRLRIGTETRHLDLLRKLAFSSGEQSAFILYVLHTSRCHNALGRYQSPLLTSEAINRLSDEFGSFLNSDGRHDFWLHVPETNATLVWDRHNLIYGYGPLERFSAILINEGIREGEAAPLPVPHVHMYHPEFDDAETRILGKFPWVRTPLSPDQIQF
jgi:hypothetical protein